MNKIERKVNDYEYYFIYNNEEIKADKCTSNLQGSSECYVNNIRYENVPYTVKKVGEHIESYDDSFNSYLSNTLFILTLFFSFIFIFKILKFLCTDMIK